MNRQIKLTLTALAIASVVSGCSQEEAEVADKSPRPVNVVELTSADSVFQQSFTGHLESVDEAKVAFRVPGTIYEIYVAPGDMVEKGDKLAQLDKHDYQVTLVELNARLREAESAHLLAKSELKRVKQAVRENAMSKVTLDRAQASYDRSKANVEVVRQNITKAADALKYTTLLAPFDGVVAQQNNEQFEQVMPGIPVFQVHNPSELQAEVDVPENLIHSFNYGQEAKVSWHGSEHPVTAVTTEIGTVPHPIKQTYTVVFELDKYDASLLPGKSVVIETQFDNPQNVYCLPYSSVFKHNKLDSVYLAKKSKAVIAPVHLQNLTGDEVCVTGDIELGDRVITSGVGFLKPNQEIGDLIITRQD